MANTMLNKQVLLCSYSAVLILGWVTNVLLVQGAVLVGSDLNMMTYTGEDTAVVGSSVREVRAAVPQNIRDLLQDGTKKAYLYTYGDDEGDDKAYHKRSKDDGNSGYKHFDSYQKKDGDKYGYAKHTAYGKSKDDKADATNHEAQYSSVADGSSYEDDGGIAKSNKKKTKKAPKQAADGTKHSYRVVEELDDDEGSNYTDGEAESEAYSADEGDDSGSYTAEDGESNSEGDSGHYEAEAEGGDEGGDGSENEHYEEGDGSQESEGYTNYEDDGGESEHYEAEADDDYD